MFDSRPIAAVLLVLAVAAGGLGVVVAEVPDARVTVDDVTVTPDAPAPDETTTVEVTVANSVGSPSPTVVENVTLRDEDRTYAVAEGVGSLSTGDALTVPLSTAFEDAGVHDLAIVVNATDDAGNVVNVTRPVRIVVGGVDAAGIDDDVQVDVREARMADLESTDGEAVDVDFDLGGGFEDVLGGAPDTSAEGPGDGGQQALTEGLVTVEVANFGTAPARDVVVDPDAEQLARVPVEDVPPGETRTVLLDVRRLEDNRTVDVVARYSLGTDRLDSTTTYEYRPDRPRLRLTDVDMVADGPSLEVTGNVANIGSTDASGVVVEAGETDYVGPTYPQRTYFVGSVPESDFVGFELTASADPENATVVPVHVTYVDDGVDREETIDLVYEPRQGEVEDTGRAIAPLAVLTLVGLTLVGAGALVWRRRDAGG